MNAAYDPREPEGSSGAARWSNAAGRTAEEAPSPDAETNGTARPSPLEGVQQSLAELLLYASHYFAALRDLAITRVRLAAFWLVVTVGLLVVGLTMAVVAVVLVLWGIALGLGALLGGNLWAGALITGGLVLTGCGVAAAVAYRWMVSQWHGQMAVKYEQYKQRERAERHL